MFGILVQKELKSIIQSPKFIASFLTFSILILLSFYTGIKEYKDYEKSYNTSVGLIESDLAQADNYTKLRYSAFREPNPMQIFSTGIANDIGRFSQISNFGPVKLTQSVYNDDPIFAVFRYIDFTFIVTIVLSLFAILFTYDSINGERENGTLRLVFSNSVPRNLFIVSKLAGTWLGLVVPILIPILIGLLLIIFSGIPFTGSDWMKIAAFLTLSLLYFTFFIAVGILVSALTRHSSTSFLVLLTIWIAFVFIIPRIGVMSAGQIIAVPTSAEIESQRDAFQRQGWSKYGDELRKLEERRDAEMKGMTLAQQEQYKNDNEFKWMEEDDNINSKREKELDEYYERILEGAKNRKLELEHLALTLSRFSPASAYQLAAMNLCGTDLEMNKRYEKAMKDYKTIYSAFFEKKQREANNSNEGNTILSINPETGALATNLRGGTMDTKDLLRFSYPGESLSAALVSSIVDMAIIIILILAAFAGAYISFLKYDLR